MTDIGDERKHKPSAKHTLEEVRKSLEDLVRNEFVDARPATAQDTEISDQPDRSTAFAPTPPQRSRQRLQTKQKRDLAASQVLKSLNELIGGDLSEPDHQDSVAVPDTTLTPPSLESAGGAGPNTEVDTDIAVDAPTPEPGDTELTDGEMSAHTESLETLAAELAVVDETDPDIDLPASEPGPAEPADQEMLADTESLRSVAAELALVDEVEATTSDDVGDVEEISWEQFSEVNPEDAVSIAKDDADDLDATIDRTIDIEPPTDPEEITLAAAPPDLSPAEALTDDASSSTPTAKDDDLDADTPDTPDAAGIEASLDDAEVDAAETPTPTSSDPLPKPELSLADDSRDPHLTKDTAVPADSSAPSGMATPDQFQETMEYPEDEADSFVPETQQIFDFESAAPGRSASEEAIKTSKHEIIDEKRPKEPHETTEIPDGSPRQSEDSELRLEDTKSELVEPAGEMVPLVPDEEMSMELGAELEATRETRSSADDTSIEDDAPALGPMDALEIPGEAATSERAKEEDQTAMQNSGHEHSTAISREKADTTTVLLTPEETPAASQESEDAPTVELEQPGVEQQQRGEPASESSQPAAPTPAEKPQKTKPTGTKQESKPVVTLPSDKPAKAGAKAPTKSPKHKAFTVASAVEAKELKIPGIDFNLGTAADKGTRSVGPQPNRSGTAGDSSPDDSEYIDLAEPASATDTAPSMKSSKESVKRTPWPTPSALFRKDSAPKPKRMPWGQNKGTGARAKGSPRVIEPPLSTAKTHISAKTSDPKGSPRPVEPPLSTAKTDISTKTSDSPEQLKQPKPKARIETKPKARAEKGAENIPVLNEVVDQPAQSKQSKKKPAPLATPKVASPGASNKKQSRHKALEASSPTSKAGARNVAVNVIAKLNMELRKCGERALSPVTIDRLQFLLREALERYAKDMENGPKRR